MQLKTETLLNKVHELETRVSEYEQLIEAIRTGEVDAFAITNNNEREVFTLQTGDYAYRVLVEKFSEGALNLTEEGLIVYSNGYFYDFLGLPHEKILGSYIFDYVASDSKDRFNQLFRQALKGNSKGEINLSIDDKLISVYVSLTTLQPHLSTVGMIVADLTEKKNNQQIISGYQSQLERTNELLLNKNKQLEQQILLEFSEEFSEYKTGSEFFNSLTQSLADKTKLDYALIGELFHSEQKDLIRTISMIAFGSSIANINFDVENNPASEVLNNSLYSCADNCREHFSGNSMLMQLGIEGFIGYPLLDTNKKPIGLIALMHSSKIEDVAYAESLLRIAAKRAEMEMERKRNEQELAAKNTELQNQNAELASFNYIASHDLQEPLRKIQAFVSRILQKEFQYLTDSGKDYFRRISDSAAGMQSLIQALLSYSRMNATDTLFVPADLNYILEDVKKDIAYDLQLSNVQIDSSPLPTVKVIPMQFHQLFLNIIGNAIKYHKAGVTPHIQITSKKVSASEVKTDSTGKGRYWQISISDNGIGFEEIHSKKVFELFQRLHTKTEYEGTGIGLAICKKIMQNHNGFISANSRAGAGTTINLFLPVDE